MNGIEWQRNNRTVLDFNLRDKNFLLKRTVWDLSSLIYAERST